VLVSLGADLPRVRQEVNSLIAGGAQTPGGRRVRDPRDAPGHSSPSREPHCPSCSRSVTEAARFRTIVVAPDQGDAESLSIQVVYCTHCGTVLHMVKADGPS
jgi:hypothetical protein